MKLENVENPSRYPNDALIVHEGTPLQNKILEVLSELQKKKNGSVFKFRALSAALVDQFTKDSEYVDPLIRAG